MYFSLHYVQIVEFLLSLVHSISHSAFQSRPKMSLIIFRVFFSLRVWYYMKSTSHGLILQKKMKSESTWSLPELDSLVFLTSLLIASSSTSGISLLTPQPILGGKVEPQLISVEDQQQLFGWTPNNRRSCPFVTQCPEGSSRSAFHLASTYPYTCIWTTCISPTIF